MNSRVEDLIYTISKLPGLGPRSARRIVIDLICGKSRNLGERLVHNLIETLDTIRDCKVCRNIDEKEICYVCRSNKRDSSTICVVQDVSDLLALEKSGAFNGKYHVLRDLLSAVRGTNPKNLGIEALLKRVKKDDVKEVILALNPTMEGDNTRYYILEKLKPLKVKTSSLANGVPIGGELEYLDEGTLEAALNFRTTEE